MLRLPRRVFVRIITVVLFFICGQDADLIFEETLSDDDCPFKFSEWIRLSKRIVRNYAIERFS